MTNDRHHRSTTECARPGADPASGRSGASPSSPRWARLPWEIALSLLALTGAWHLVSALLGNAEILPPPARVAAAWLEMARQSEAYYDIVPLRDAVVQTLSHLLRGYVAGVAVGFVLALAAVSVRSFDVVVDPLVELLRPISGLAWYPLAILLLGQTDVVAIVLVFYVAIFPTFVNTAAGLRSVDTRLLAAAATLGASRLRVVTHVTLPAASPMILAGLRLSLGVSWMTVIAAEVLGSDYPGMGELIFAYEREFAQTKVMATIVTIGLVGFVLDYLVRRVERRLAHWRPTMAGA